MKAHMTTALAIGALALAVSPTALAAGKPETLPPHGHGAANGPWSEYTAGNPTPGPKAGLPAKAKAYGRYCKGESKQHVKGEKGTDFSRCVKAAAKLRHHEHEEESP
jgi:hypothetical protein